MIGNLVSDVLGIGTGLIPLGDPQQGARPIDDLAQSKTEVRCRFDCSGDGSSNDGPCFELAEGASAYLRFYPLGDPRCPR